MDSATAPSAVARVLIRRLRRAARTGGEGSGILGSFMLLNSVTPVVIAVLVEEAILVSVWRGMTRSASSLGMLSGLEAKIEPP